MSKPRTSDGFEVRDLTIAMMMVFGSILALAVVTWGLHVKLLESGSWAPIVAILGVWGLGTAIAAYQSLRAVRLAFRSLGWLVVSPVALFMHVHALPNLVSLFLFSRLKRNRLIVYGSTKFAMTWVFVPICLLTLYLDYVGYNKRDLSYLFWILVIGTVLLMISDRAYFPMVGLFIVVGLLGYIPAVSAFESRIYREFEPPYYRDLLIVFCQVMIPLHVLSMVFSLVYKRHIITPDNWNEDLVLGYINGSSARTVGGTTEHTITNYLVDTLAYLVGGCGTLIFRAEDGREQSLRGVIGVRLIRSIANTMIAPLRVIPIRAAEVA